ncbi:3-methyl-2-oxobutanoate hydroxymethyltransferase [bacterium]|nr:MAG: 3-methyl-2-oxobutanoate hydroxymethyltransferase [bacterium]
MTSLQIFARKKREKTPLAMVALYDAPSAQIACDAGIDAILVGDSVGNTVLGFDSTIPVTVDAIAHHVGAVVRGVKSSSRPDVPVIADLPFGSYATPEKAVENAVRMMQLGAHAVKIEGTQEYLPTLKHDVFTAFAAAGIPVMGHLGFTPQSVLKFPGVVQAKTAPSAHKLLADALHLSEAGCFAIVLEATTEEAAREITAQLPISTIGIGAGVVCDGQVLVWHDLVGITEKPFKFSKAFGATRQVWAQALQDFKNEVENRSFPTADNSWNMTAEEVDNWAQLRGEATTDIEPLDEQPF